MYPLPAIETLKQSWYIRDAADLVSTAVTMDYIMDFDTVFLRCWAH